MQIKRPSEFLYAGFAGLLLVVSVAFFFLADLSLVFFVNQPFFSQTVEFFHQQVLQPHGFVEYLSLFGFQFYQSITLAIIFANLQLLVVFWLLHLWLKKYFSVPISLLFTVLFMLPMVVEQTNYFVMPVILITYIIVIGFALLFSKLPKKGFIHYLGFATISIMVFFVSGLYGLALYVSLILPVKLITREYSGSSIFLLIALASVLMVVYVVNHIFAVDVSYFAGFYLNRPTINQWILNFVPLFLFCIPFAKEIIKVSALRIKILWIWALGVCTIWSGILFTIAYQPVLKKCISIDRMAANNQWDQILAIDDKALLMGNQVKPILYRALYHKGILLDKLFSYSDGDDQDNLIVHGPQDVSIAVPLMEFYFNLGLINESRHWANEALTASGWHPNVLKRLIESYLLLGEYSTAMKYINLLATSPVNRASASDYQRMIHSPERIAEHPVLGRFTKTQAPPDFLVTYYNPYNNLFQLMQSQKPGAMVLEYYLAYELFRKNPQKVIESIKLFKQLQYPRLPVHCQEAILFYKALNGIKSASDMEGYVFDAAVTNRFNQFSDILFDTYGGNRATAQKALAPFSDTFWYYYLYTGKKDN